MIVSAWIETRGTGFDSHWFRFDESGSDLALFGVLTQVLSGVKIVFSGVFPSSIPLHKSREVQMAEKLGAKCCELLCLDTF
eukprot:1236212-Rhodomonas_salina.1